MNKKVMYIIVTAAFIGVLILINVFLGAESEKKLMQDNNKQSNLIENVDKEESKVEVLKVTSENFEKEVLQSEKAVLIDFYADWCGPCKMLSPVVEQVAEENSNAKVVKINVDEAQDLAIKYQVMSIPTLVVIKDGKEVNRSVGLISKSEITDMLK